MRIVLFAATVMTQGCAWLIGVDDDVTVGSVTEAGADAMGGDHFAPDVDAASSDAASDGADAADAKRDVGEAGQDAAADVWPG